ncbi:hypothetical protein PAEPH01_0298 [Pancytospora epiphaga]|nr:hypothetical protein PAEPH01_0298 [Pancytospora epiphaga]
MEVKFSTWPAPPVHSRTEPPEIPDKINIFGMEYMVENGHLALDIPCAPLDKEKIRAALLRSYNSFSKLVVSQNPENLDGIRDAHAEIIEVINKAIPFQDEFAIKEAQAKQIFAKLEVYSKIKNVLDN